MNCSLVLLLDLGETQKGGYPGFLCIVFKANVPIVHKGLFFFLAGHMSRSVDSPGQSFFSLLAFKGPIL